MGKLQLLEKLLKLFTGWKNKAFTAIGKELGDAFNHEVLIQYDHFKHWFVKEDPTAAAIWKKYEDKPDDAKAQVAVQSIAEDKLDHDPNFAETLQRELEALEAKYYDVVNFIGIVEGKGNEIQQGNNVTPGQKISNKIGHVKGDDNKIIQGTNPTGELP